MLICPNCNKVDYEYPLLVNWLCEDCHKDIHKELKLQRIKENKNG